MPIETAPPAPGPRIPGITPRTRVVVLVGNPRPSSRTAAAGTRLGRHLADALTESGQNAAEVIQIDLADLAPELLAPEHPRVDEALRTAATADVLVVATPVHKASVPGLLKLFLDQYGPRGLRDVTTVTLLVPGDAAHTLVGDVHLRPVLVELGAVLPAATLVVPAPALADLEAMLQTWWDGAQVAVLRAAGAAPDAGADQ